MTPTRPGVIEMRGEITVSLIAAIIQAWFVFASPTGSRVRTSALVLAAAVVVQAALGIWTLLAQVPLGLGLMHQGGAAIVMALAIWHLHETRQLSSQLYATLRPG